MRRLRLFAPTFYPALIVGILLLFLLIRANVVLSHFPDFLSEWSTAAQFWVFCAAVVLITLGLGLTHTVNLHISKKTQSDLLILAGIALFALVLRLLFLEDAVHIFVHDEFWFTEGVNRFQRDPYTPLLQPFMDPAPYIGIFPFMQLLSVEIFGATLSALRLPSVLLGTGTVVVTYLLTQQLFSRRAAIIAALFLAAFPPHIHFSRLGLNNIADPFFGALALTCLARGLLHEGQAANKLLFAIGGSALGMTLYFYDAGKFIFTPLVLGWLLCLFAAKRLRRQHITPLLIFGAAALLVSLPMVYTTAARGFSVSARMEQMTWGLRYLTEDIYNIPAITPLEVVTTYVERYIFPVLAHYVYSLDSEPYFYGGYTAMLLPPFALLFLGAVGYFLWNWRDARSQLILLWLLLTTLGISLIYPATWTIRYPVVFPALALMIGVLCERIIARFPRVRRPLWVLLGLLIFSQPVYYFAFHLPLYNAQIRPQADYVDAMYRAAQFPRRAQVYFITDDWVDVPRTWTLKDFWSLDVEVFYQPTMSEAELNALPRDVDLILFINQDDTEMQQVIQRVFTTAQPLLSPYDIPLDKQYLMFYIAAEQ